jgi:hypothetical protein
MYATIAFISTPRQRASVHAALHAAVNAFLEVRLLAVATGEPRILAKGLEERQRPGRLPGAEVTRPAVETIPRKPARRIGMVRANEP